MLVNYRSYYRMIFTVTSNKIGAQKENKLFLLDKLHKFQNQCKLNIIKQQNTVLIHIANDIKNYE